jgi:hypothetical protein
MEERVYVEAFESEAKQYVPDVHVYETRRPVASSIPSGATAAVAEPIVVQVPAEITERFIQILDVRSGGRVVTVIEVLSPANKLPGRGRKEYQAKQFQYLEAGVNVVEIDLLRIGQHTTLARLGLISPEKITTYHVSTFRASRPEFFEYYRIPLRTPLPRLPIPLRATDPDAVLDLQAILDTAYDRGRYDDIDYSRPLQPPLDPADQQWADQLFPRPT